VLEEVEAEEREVEGSDGKLGERAERDVWEGEGVLRRIDESLLRACRRRGEGTD
jgi:hypothetical protein